MTNIPLLRKALEHVIEHPAEHDQLLWVIATPCGTTMCFAGHAAALAGHEVRGTGQVTLDSGCSAHVADVARYELGLTENEAARLFSATNTLDDLIDAVADITNGEVDLR